MASNQGHRARVQAISTLIAATLLTASCASYRTPGAGVNIGNLPASEGDIAELMSREPAATFPVRLAIVRVEATGYYSYNSHCYGQGRFCVVTTRDIETDPDFATIAMVCSPFRLDTFWSPRMGLRKVVDDGGDRQE